MRLSALSAAIMALAGLLPACLTPAAQAQTGAPVNQNQPRSQYQVQPGQQGPPSAYGPQTQQQTQPPSNYGPPQNVQQQNLQPRGNYPPPQNVSPQAGQPQNIQPRSAYAPNGQPGQQQPVRVATNPNAVQQTGGVQPLPPAQNQPPQNRPPQDLRLPQYAPGGAPQQNVPNGPVQVQQQAPQRHRFQLTMEQEQNLHRWLEKWEADGEQIKNFACKFERWEYDPVFGPGANEPKTKGYGDLKYVKPDKGHFKIEKLTHYTPAQVPTKPPTYEERAGEFGEHWVCDGKMVFEYKFDVKKLMCYEIPEEMRGKAISNGPLPFLFGAKKAELLERYDMKVTNETDDQVWLDAWPLRRQDAANFQHVEVILDRNTMHPKAMQVYMPNGKNRMVYIFQAPSVNNSLSPLLDWFEQPRTPLGWEKVIERAPTQAEIEAQRQARGGQQPPAGFQK